MKILKNISFALLMLLASSCTESFLENDPDTSIPTDDVFKSYDLAEAALIGAYNTTSSYVFAGLYDPITSDLMGEDLKLIDGSLNFGWFVEVYQMDLLPIDTWVEYPWTAGYSVIYEANNIYNNAYKIEDGEASDIERLKGESLALRAYCLLQMAHMYCDAYSANPQAPGLILPTQPASVIDPYLGRMSLEDTYTQIENDLLNAEQILSNDSIDNNTDRGRMNKQSVQALLARTYLDMEQWEDARDYAQKAIDHAGTDLVTADGLLYGFAAQDDETIFMLDYTTDDNNVYLSIPSFYFPIYGYSSMRASQDFYSLFNATDARYSQFLTQDPETTDEADLIDGENVMILKFMHNGTLGNAKTIKIRASEMYLILAEAEANLGNTTEAVDALYAIQSRADLSASKSANSGADLITEILLERRKELYGEGFRLNDIKRTQQRVIRDSDHWVKFDYDATDADYYRFTLPIPQSEFDSNNALSEADQNTGY